MSFPSLVKKIHVYKSVYSQCWCFTKRFYGIANFKAGGNPQPPSIFLHAFPGGYQGETKFNRQLQHNPGETELQPKRRKCSGEETESHFGVAGLRGETFQPGFILGEWDGWEVEEGAGGRGVWVCMRWVGRCDGEEERGIVVSLDKS